MDLEGGIPDTVAAADLVVHAAWVTTDPTALGVSTQDYINLNLRPLRAALAYAARVRPSAFVFPSSSGVFAPGDGSEGLRDSDRPTGSSPYAVAKRAGETLVPTALEGCHRRTRRAPRVPVRPRGGGPPEPIGRVADRSLAHGGPREKPASRPIRRSRARLDVRPGSRSGVGPPGGAPTRRPADPPGQSLRPERSRPGAVDRRAAPRSRHVE